MSNVSKSLGSFETSTVDTSVFGSDVVVNAINGFIQTLTSGKSKFGDQADKLSKSLDSVITNSDTADSQLASALTETNGPSSSDPAPVMNAGNTYEQ